MMNSASIATGTYPGIHGFYGNVVYAPNAKGKNAKGVDIDFSAPAFIEDFGVVEAVRDSYQGKLTRVSPMLQAGQAKGLTTAAVGKFGAAFIQDYHPGGHHPRRGRGDPAEFREGAPERRIRPSEEH